MARATVIYIGGPSQSGKTTTAGLLVERGFQHVNLDKDPEIIAIKALPDRSQIPPKLKARAFEIIDRLDIDSVTEGSQLWPDDVAARALCNVAFHAVYCGYPELDPKAKLAQIERGGFANARHIARLDPQGRLKRIERYVDIGRKIRAQCERHGYPFFDFSDLTDLDRRQRELVDRVLELCRRT